jgi:DNA-binding IclR family transcriptional regulator
MPLAPAEIARYTGLTRSRATTAIRTLMEMGEVIRNEAGYFELAGKRYV